MICVHEQKNSTEMQVLMTTRRDDKCPRQPYIGFATNQDQNSMKWFSAIVKLEYRDIYMELAKPFHRLNE